MATVETPKRSALPVILGILVVLVAIGAAGGWYVLQYAGDWQAKASLDKAITELPPNVKASYGEVHASLLDHTTSLTNFSMTFTGDTPGTLTVDKVEVLNPAIDFPEIWAKIEAKTLQADRDTTLALADMVTVKGLKIKFAGAEIGIGDYTVKKIRLHPWALIQSGTPATRDLVQSLKTAQGSADVEALVPLLRYTAAWMLASDYDSLEMTALGETVHMPKSASLPAGTDISVTLDHASANGLHQGVMGAITEEGMNEEIGGPAKAKIKITKVTVEPFDFHSAVERLVAGEPLSLDMLDGLKWNGIAIDGITVTTDEVGSISLAGFALNQFAFDKGQLEGGHIALKSLKLTAAQIPAAAIAFQGLDLKTATISADAGYHLSPAGNDLRIHTHFAVDELGVLEDNVELVAPGGFKATDVMTPGQVPNVKLKHATLKYRDHSLARRLIKMGAAMQNQKPDQFQEQIVAMVRQQSAVLGTDPNVTALVEAVVTFVKDPKFLDIEIAPPKPLSTEQMDALEKMPPAKLLPMLGIKILANVEPEKKP